MEHAICTVAAAPVRKEPAHRSEMINQLLFGECMEVLSAEGEWYRVRSIYDGYEGWVTHHLIEAVDASIATAPPRFIANALVNPVTVPDSLINAPMGAHLTGLDEEIRLLWDADYKYHGTYRDTSNPPHADLLLNLVHPWINAPYLWGGETFMGVDCSGFVQTVFKIMGIALLRDAWQQAEGGEPVERLADSKEGDLAFFHNEKGRATHVGILLAPDRIIHASGKVRIDHLDEAGIINRDNGKRTHHQLMMRRYF